MGRTFNKDERPTSNEKTNIKYRRLLSSDFSERYLFLGNPKSAIQNQKSGTHRIKAAQPILERFPSRGFENSTDQVL